MSYHLNTTRVLYAISRYAPVAVIQVDVVIPENGTLGLSKAQIDPILDRISASSGGVPLSLSGEGSPAEVYCDLVLGLQRHTGHPVQYSRVRAIEKTGDHRAFIEYEDQAAALYAAELAVELLNAIMASQGNPDAETIARLQQNLDEYVSYSLARRMDPNTRLLIQAAKRQDIPSINLDQRWDMPTWPGTTMEKSDLVQFGWGVKQRRCRGPVPAGFSSMENLGQISDRAQLLPRLKKAAIPLAGQDLEFINRNQVSRAQRSARRIGYPVALRPRVNTPFQYRLADNHVYGPLHNDAQVALIANHLREHTTANVWVESHVSGEHYRFLVLGGKVLSVIRCTPPTVAGDGIHDIAGLAQHRADTARDIATYRNWHALAQGDSAVDHRLQLEDMSLDSVPAAGTQVALRGFGTLYNGGNCQQVTREIPAQFTNLAARVAGLSGLGHLAGVDIIIDKLSGPAALPNCAVTGVLPDPDLRVHELLSPEHPRDLGDRYMAQLFPAGSSARIPTVAVTGTNGKTTTCRMVARILRTKGWKVGLSCTDGVYLDDELLLPGDESGVMGANDVLMTPRAEAAVLETARGALARMGIAFDRCDVGACLNVTADHLGQEGIKTLDEMAVHKRQVIERASGAVILNAEDPNCLAMADHSVAEEVILIAHSENHPAIRTHCHAGGRAIVMAPGATGNRICKIDRQGTTPLLAVNQIPATLDGKAFFNVENAMAAAAICTGLGISDDLIIKGLGEFRMTPENTPGRLNVFDVMPFRVIVDYAHNAHAISAFCKLARQMNVEGRRIAVIGTAGDRIDAEIRKNAGAVAADFDYFICRDSIHLRGRPKGETMKLMYSALLDHGIESDRIETIPDPEDAVKRAFSTARPGDLVVIFVGYFFWEPLKLLLEKQGGTHRSSSRLPGNDQI